MFLTLLFACTIAVFFFLSPFLPFFLSFFFYFFVCLDVSFLCSSHPSLFLLLSVSFFLSFFLLFTLSFFSSPNIIIHYSFFFIPHLIHSILLSFFFLFPNNWVKITLDSFEKLDSASYSSCLIQLDKCSLKTKTSMMHLLCFTYSIRFFFSFFFPNRLCSSPSGHHGNPSNLHRSNSKLGCCDSNIYFWSMLQT